VPPAWRAACGVRGCGRAGGLLRSPVAGGGS